MYHKRGNVYNQLLLLFIMIMLPLILIGTGVLLTDARRIQNETLSKELSATHNTLCNINDSIDSLYTANLLLFNQSNIRMLSDRIQQLSIYESMVAVNTLREQLTSINSANPFIEHMRVYFRDWERVYNSDNYPKGSYQEILTEDFNALASQVRQNKTGISKNGCLSVFIVNNPLREPASIIEVVLSTSNLKSLLESLIVYPEDYYLLSAAHGSFQLHNLPGSVQAYLPDILSDPTIYQDGTITLDGTTYYVLSEALPAIDGHFIRLISIHSLSEGLHTLTIFTILFLTLIVVACILFFVQTRRLIHQPLSELVSGFAQVEQGNYTIQIDYNSKNEFAYLHQSFNQMVHKIHQFIENNYKMKLLLQQAELKQLQAQINPHFLYNSFFMLRRCIKSELHEEAAEISFLLGKYFQYITKNADNLIPLSAEYEHAKIYSKIQELRFEGRIEAKFEELPSEYASLPVPKLILQPVIENAYKYGLADKVQDGLLRVRFDADREMLRIYIEDNGENLSPNALASLKQSLRKAQSGDSLEITGILNICKRLDIFSNGQGSLYADRSPLGGLSICITLAKESENEPIIDC